MALEDDSANAHQTSTEQSPLLGHPSPALEEDARSEASEAPPPENAKRPKSWYAWRIFWAVVVAIVIAVFVKGWIDADNTNVCNLDFPMSLVHELTNSQFDLKGALKRALGGGLSGAAAMVLQVLLLMVRTSHPLHSP